MPSANKSPETRTVTFLNRVKLDKLLEIKNWDGLDFTTVDTAFESFINILNELKEKAKEERKIRITNNSKNRKRAPWLSHESLQLTLFKKDIYKAMNKQKGKDQVYDELLSKFKSVSAEVVKSIRKDKQIYYNNKLNHCTSSKDYWRELKKICKRDRKTEQPKIKIIDETTKSEISDPSEIVENLNAHYSAIAEKEISKNPLFRSNSKIDYSLGWEKSSVHSFVSHEITIYDLHRAVKKLSKKNSSSDDGIVSADFKRHWEKLGVPLLLIFNYSRVKGTFLQY